MQRPPGGGPPGNSRETGRPNLIDRDPQLLPVPIGGLRVVRNRRRVPALLKWWRRNLLTIVTGTGLLAGAVGAYFSLSGAPVPVYLQGGDVHIGANILVAQPTATPTTTTYTSPGVGALVIRWGGRDAASLTDGEITAGASTVSHGKPVSGWCQTDGWAVDAAQLQEDCSFVIDTLKVTAHDTFDLQAASPSWHRHYSDGIDATISVPSSGAVVPVPFPVGR